MLRVASSTLATAPTNKPVAASTAPCSAVAAVVAPDVRTIAPSTTCGIWATRCWSTSAATAEKSAVRQTPRFVPLLGATSALSHRRCTGTIRFVGRVDFATGTWVGIDLAERKGRNDGSVAGERYFDCSAKHGLFLKNYSTSVRPAPATAEAQRQRGRQRYDETHGREPPSPRKARRQEEAATHLQRSFRGMRERSATRVQQRMNAWDELDMHDEVDFLQKHRGLSQVRQQQQSPRRVLSSYTPSHQRHTLLRLSRSLAWLAAAAAVAAAHSAVGGEVRRTAGGRWRSLVPPGTHHDRARVGRRRE